MTMGVNTETSEGGSQHDRIKKKKKTTTENGVSGVLQTRAPLHYGLSGFAVEVRSITIHVAASADLFLTELTET